MTTLILIFLVLNVVGQAFHTYRDALVYTRNTALYLAQIKELQQSNADYLRAIQRMAGQRFDDTGLILTPDGVKALPEGWRDLLWPAKVQVSLEEDDGEVG